MPGGLRMVVTSRPNSVIRPAGRMVSGPMAPAARQPANAVGQFPTHHRIKVRAARPNRDIRWPNRPSEDNQAIPRVGGPAVLPAPG